MGACTFWRAFKVGSNGVIIKPFKLTLHQRCALAKRQSVDSREQCLGSFARDHSLLRIAAVFCKDGVFLALPLFLIDEYPVATLTVSDIVFREIHGNAYKPGTKVSIGG